MPKLYFYDTGIVCSLLGINDVSQIATHYLKGALFENMIIAELVKARLNQGNIANFYFWRDQTGHEVDCIEQTTEIIPIEIKSGRTVNQDYFSDLKYWKKLAPEHAQKAYVVYGGREKQLREDIQLLSWEYIQEI